MACIWDHSHAPFWRALCTVLVARPRLAALKLQSVTLFCNPVPKFWRFPEDPGGRPTREKVDSTRERRLWRIREALGQVAGSDS
jgi:hypothetical protein